MDYLICCPCNHRVSDHDDHGCRGAQGTCACTLTRVEALDASIAAARSFAVHSTTARERRAEEAANDSATA